MNKNPLTILNWNANSIAPPSKRLELIQLLDDKAIDVACLTETHLNPQKNLHIPNFVTHRKDRPTAGGGVAILVRKTLRHKAISSNIQPHETIGIELQLPGGPLRIFTCYSSPNCKNTTNLHTLLDSSTPTVVAGDFNAKHTAWGCKFTNPKGKSLLRSSIRHNFTIESPHTPTHLPGANRQPDILDIFLTKNVPLSKDPWSISALSSDHFPVFLELQEGPSLSPPAKTKIDHVKLQYLLETSTYKSPQIHSPDELDNAVADITSSINNCIQEATLSVTTNRPRANLPAHIRNLIRKKNKARKLWQSHRDPRLRRSLNALQRTIKSSLQEINNAAFVKYIAEAEAHPKSCWKVIRSLRNRKAHLPPLVVNDTHFSLDEEKANIFATSLSAQCSPFPSSPQHENFHREVEASLQLTNTTDTNFPPASPKEIQDIIRLLKNRKAPGPDTIGNGVLKTLPKKYIVAICNIVNAMMRLQYFPSAWKLATVICLPKPGKPLSSPTSYRPISLLSSISKVAESIILSRLNTHVEQNNILPEFQHGFRKQHGTAHQLLRVTEFLADMLNKRRHTTMLLLDAKQAFDRVWHPGLIHKLTELNFPDYLIGTIKSFLADRRFRVRVGESLSDPHLILAGVPQGSKLSPTLFNIYCHDIPTNDKILLAQYADDVALLSSSRTIVHSGAQLNSFIPKAMDWYQKWRFAINEAKSEAVFFSRRKRTPPNLSVNSHRIKWSSSAKYLGIILDRNLSWCKQIQATRNKIIGAYTQLKPFFSNNAVSRSTKLRAFNAIIRSICSYAIPIWGSARPNRIAKLQGTYMRLLRAALDIPWFIRNNQILQETKLPSIPDAATKFATNLRVSVSSHANPSINILSQYKHKPTDRFRRPCLLIPSD